MLQHLSVLKHFVCYTLYMSSNPEEITFFAQTDARGASVPFGIKAKDRTRHVYVIGKTGMGKSTLLENMAIQDIKNGNGLAFIDPHGQTAETLLDYIPESRKDDVLYFAPFDTDNPVSFNVMEDVEPDRRHLVVSGLMSVFKKIWVDAWSARMEYILSNTLLALLEYPDATLLGVNRMLSDKVYRKKVIDNITDPSVKSFWVDEFLKYNERYMQEAGDAIKNKTGQFTSNPLIRNIVGQPKSSFDIREMMDQKKILIINLSKGLVGETNANLLGSMITTRIYLAAMSRADMSQEEMKNAPNFYFYVDEFQSFANATFANILSEARKYKLNLTIAHQYIEQMEEEVRDAVFGNVGTTIAFRVGPFDAEVLETVFTPKFLAPDIVNLGFAQIYLTLMIDGIGSQPFSATTLPPIKPASISCKEMIIHRSREQFSKKRAEVEKAIYEWHGMHDLAGTSKEVVAQAPKASLPERREIPVVEPRRIETEKQEAKREYPRRNDESVKRPQASEESKPSSLMTKHDAPHNHKEASHRSKEVEIHRKDPKNSPLVHKERDSSEAQKSTKNLDELRAILRTISASETEKKNVVSSETSAERPAKVESKREHTEEKKEHGQQSLKEALSSALRSENSQKTIVQDVQVETHVKEVESKVQMKVPVLQQVQKSESVQQPQPAFDDPLSPKKLERMMRVTGNDRTPLS